jgi:hypothetical protein
MAWRVVKLNFAAVLKSNLTNQIQFFLIIKAKNDKHKI